ncbi:winged helix-turn-helix transcriptional regulator, partial [Streptomyces lydicus]
MGTKRYAQMCAVAAALDLVGERWTLLIIRDLTTGPKRYNQLLEETLVGIGPNLLAARLQMLT